MPQSWVMVPRRTSERMSTCLAGENTDARFESCVHEIVSSHKGSVLKVKHLGHDRFSHVHFDAPDEKIKQAVMLDLDAQEIEDPGPR